MKLNKVTGKAFTIKCIKCGKKAMSDTEQFSADAEGKPFEAYYCERCAGITHKS